MLRGLPKIIGYVYMHHNLLDHTYFILKIKLTPRLELVIAGQINYPVLVATRLSNQTSFCAASVRQRGRQMESSRAIAEKTVDDESPVEFRRRVMQYLTSMLPADSPHESMSGVTRQVRHTGVVHEQSGESGGARKNDKAVARNVRAKVSRKLHFVLFSLMQGLHFPRPSAAQKRGHFRCFAAFTRMHYLLGSHLSLISRLVTLSSLSNPLRVMTLSLLKVLS